MEGILNLSTQTWKFVNLLYAKWYGSGRLVKVLSLGSKGLEFDPTMVEKFENHWLS